MKKNILPFLRLLFLFLLIDFMHFSTLYAQNTIRYATKEDVKLISNASIGDLIISGGTEESNGLPAIWIGPTANWPLQPGKKILIKGGVYDWIAIYNTSTGNKKNPIVITNYDGQVETKELHIKGLKFFRLTGKYDITKKTGSKNYQGHDKAYAYSQGKYGIYVNNKWTKSDEFLLEISGFKGEDGVEHPTSDYEVDFIESGNGGYTNVFKFNGKKNIVDNVNIHDCYFHDTGGEAIYLGNTDWSSSQEVFRNFNFYNNRLLRAGLDGLQLNRIGENSNIYNNVIDGGMNWKGPFEKWQDFGASLSFVNGSVSVRNNIIINGSGAFFQAHFRPEPWYSVNTKIGGTVIFENNLFLNTKSPEGVFIGPGDIDLVGVSARFTHNDFNKWKFRYDELHPDVENNSTLISSFYAGTVLVDSNRIDGSNGKKEVLRSDYKGKTKVFDNKISPIEPIAFENFIGNGFGYPSFEMWCGRFEIGELKDEPVIYDPGAMVTWHSKIYKCIKRNSNVEPGVDKGWQKCWVLYVFNDGKPYFLPDDVRVKQGNYHQKLNRGLLYKK
jgi:hypothetical protein